MKITLDQLKKADPCDKKWMIWFKDNFGNQTLEDHSNKIQQRRGKYTRVKKACQPFAKQHII